MFSADEIKRNLLGGLEVALLMPNARRRFGNSQEEAMRSFIVPILLFPLTLLGVYLYPQPGLGGNSENMIALLYSLRLTLSWVLFLGFVYWLLKEVDRKEHFWQFVTAINWLNVPATLIFAPIAWMLLSGSHSWSELYPMMVCLSLYSYFFTAHMAANVLRIPWELAGFIAVIGLMINDYTTQVLEFVGAVL